MGITISGESNSPIYKQLVESVMDGIRSGSFKEGDILPSMNVLASDLNISKETVKKAYSILTRKGFIEPKQGLGFFVAKRSGSDGLSILILLDKISPYKQILLNTLSRDLGPDVQSTIRLHNQSEELLEYYLDEGLDSYDYYLIEPHFALNDETQKNVVKQLKRVPFRKLIMVDNWIKDIPGLYGAVYQDFEHDIYDGLSQGLDELKRYKALNVVIFQSSLYHEQISKSVKRFCRDNDIKVEFITTLSTKSVKENEAYLLLNSQLDSNLLDLTTIAKEKNLEIGKDIAIISYNEYPVNELVLGGLSTVSSNFPQMGHLIAEMILSRDLKKIKCDFNLRRRKTF